MKKCSNCKEQKNQTEFHRDKTRRDGYHYTCKACKKPYFTRYWRENREKIQARCRANYCPEKEKIKREKCRKNEVYKLIFPNGSYYIGQSTWGANRRLGWHFKGAAGGNPHINKMIQNGLKRNEVIIEIVKAFPKGQEGEMKSFEALLIEQSLKDPECLNIRVVR